MCLRYNIVGIGALALPTFRTAFEILKAQGRALSAADFQPQAV